MAAPAPVVQVVGMAALRRDVARLTGTNSTLNALLSAAGREALQPVADWTKAALPQADPTPGRLAGDVRVTASRTGAAVRMGRASIRYAGWVEFGGTRRVPVFSSRDYDPRGRYLWPAARQLAGESARLYTAAVTKGLDGFDWTNEGTTAHD
jgi:hypothetical protein